MGSPQSTAVSFISQFMLLLLSFLIEPSLATEQNAVTCGSVIKLLNIKHNVRLHSHDVRYGSGEFPLIQQMSALPSL